MMNSMWSGVAGMQAHQTSMDIEGHNIANVNTPGFKYSRANFAELLSQTQKIATAPDGAKGGTNEAQIGLGTSVNSTTRVFSQGAPITTDKLTDLAIQGDGFFMVTADGGSTYRYTRNGNFAFDAAGNFVDQNGLKVQGWVKDLNPNNAVAGTSISNSKVDSTQPVTDIRINPGLRVPANPTAKIDLKANLNSGSVVDSKVPIFSSVGTQGYTYNAVIAETPISETPSAFANEREVYYTGPRAGIVSNHNSNGYQTGTNMAVLANPTGKFFNLQSATNDPMAAQNGEAVRYNGQGIMLTVSDTSTPPKQHYYEFRYTDGNTTKGNPAPSQFKISDGTIVANNQNNTALSINQIILPNDESRTPRDAKVVYFTTDQELRLFMQSVIRDVNQDGTADFNATLSSDASGKFSLTNANPVGGNNIKIGVTPISDVNTTPNNLFKEILSSLEGQIDPQQTRYSGSLHVPSHSASINVYDSLGSRYSVRFKFQKTGIDTWSWSAEVPKPASLLGGVAPNENILRGGTIEFTRNGALKAYSPPNLTFNTNRGAEPNQVIQLDMGSIGGFGGVTHLDKASETAGINQDGYTGGSLEGTRIDNRGVIIGKFSNDRSFALGQIAMASFNNNSGLSAAGNNLYTETSNSGEAIIGLASTGGKGSINAKSLENSNVDLTRSLTQLIVVQRGFQANSKTITTSDQMLNTLLQMKQ